MLDQHLTHLARSFPLVHALTPINWSSELARLTDAIRRGIPAEPRFVYRSLPLDPALPRALDALADKLDCRDHRNATRARALALELHLVLAVGTPAFLSLARRRFSCLPEEDRQAESWAALSPSLSEEEQILSDNERDPRSLLSRLRSEVAVRRLPIRVCSREALASLAAFGGGTLLVATGHRLSIRVAQRIALHEVVGHAVPWWNRGGNPPEDPYKQDQEEGHALQVEDRAGFLDDSRRKELGLRHIACRLAHEEEPFSAIVTRLVDLGCNVEEAVRTAARALRGGGLGRERVYLPWFWRLEGKEGSADP
ncbi:MAG: DUF1704 domain-containing protein [Myxococcales bacterium]|nr:flavohemoglobin expression-modulating QEGLA motif protein [Polyangiaceae bacterium]MDW8248137.1 DUF1704 domain-containing protein [Myxococcales bacterium]